MTDERGFSHLDSQGKARMVDVSDKDKTNREAVAAGFIGMQPDTMKLLVQGAPKGDVLAVARVAGIMAAKQTQQLIPLCHNVPLTSVSVDFSLDTFKNRVAIQATAKCTWNTGVEMEALTAVSVAALTIYDMCKAVDRGMVIGEIRLLKKTGGCSGSFDAETNI
ncbi:MAG TPA: cyclic pyranopterin monophosphate synthase MoaC [Firmicutes bacterium]|nr:cyclic pyranopterin monophosphate synthase MoaC [Bacillota bacterium]